MGHLCPPENRQVPLDGSALAGPLGLRRCSTLHQVISSSKTILAHDYAIVRSARYIAVPGFQISGKEAATTCASFLSCYSYDRNRLPSLILWRWR